MVIVVVIYLDLLILSTILVNYLFIKTIAIIFKEKLSFLRVVIALLLSCLMLCLYLLPYKIYFVIRYFMGIIIGIVAFKKTDVKSKIIKIVIFYLLNMAFIGTLVVFRVKNIIPLLLTVFFVIILYIIENYKLIFNKNSNYNCLVRIKNLKLKGLIDTGNLATYEKIPIVFIKQKFFSKDFSYFQSSLIKGIFGEKIMPLYQGPSLSFNNKNYTVYYIFIDEIDYDIILNNLMKEDN